MELRMVFEMSLVLQVFISSSMHAAPRHAPWTISDLLNVSHGVPSHIQPSQPMHGFHVSVMVHHMQSLNRHITRYTLLNLT